MPEHDPDAVTTGWRPGRPMPLERSAMGSRQEGGQGSGRRRGRLADRSLPLMYAAAYLLDSPCTQQLLVWGGHQARDLVAQATGLLGEQQRLASAASAWRSASDDLHHAAGELAGSLAGLAGWESAAAESFREAHLARVEHVTALGETYRGVAATLTSTAEQAGRVFGALLGATLAAAESVRLLADGTNPGTAASAVVAAWATVSHTLLDAWAAHADHASATLAALHAGCPPAGGLGRS